MSRVVTLQEAAEVLVKSVRALQYWRDDHGAPGFSGGGQGEEVMVDLDAVTEWAKKTGRKVGVKSKGGRRPKSQRSKASPGGSSGRSDRAQAGARGRAGASEAEPESKTDPTYEGDYSEAKRRKEWALVKLNELKLQKESGKVHSIEECHEERLRRITAVKAGLDAIPGKIAGRLAMRTEEEIREELALEMVDIQLRFAEGWMSEELKAPKAEEESDGRDPQ